MSKPAPWRKVVKSTLCTGRGGECIGPDTSRRTRWWACVLECGHEVERPAAYVKATGVRNTGGWLARSASEVLPAPKRVRCEACRGNAPPSQGVLWA